MKTYTADTRPRCVAFVHRAMGTMDICGKYADWVLTGASLHAGTKPVCRDCVAKVLINTGDGIDDISFDAIVIVKD